MTVCIKTKLLLKECIEKFFAYYMKQTKLHVSMSKGFINQHTLLLVGNVYFAVPAVILDLLKKCICSHCGRLAIIITLF